MELFRCIFINQMFKTMKSLPFLLSAGLIVISLVACKKSQKVTVNCDGSTPTYNSYVKGIVNSNCTSCHSSYSTYAGLSAITSNGKFEKEVLINQTMPDGGSLTQDELNKLQCWVNNGFPEN